MGDFLRTQRGGELGGSDGQMNPFGKLAKEYDRWFDSPRGRAIFEAELGCLRELMPGQAGRWLEVGVGTGRFAEALGIEEGVDPSRPMLELARRRGLQVKRGHGEELPYANAFFDGVLMVVTVCFLSDPGKAFAECRRVLKVDGCLVVGLVPADSPWGESYAQRGREGHPLYGTARFHTCNQVTGLLQTAGFVRQSAISSLLSSPSVPVDGARQSGVVAGAGFVALKFQKTVSNEQDAAQRVALGEGTGYGQ